MADPNQPARLDPREIRQITTRSGTRIWVIPGQRGLCVAALDQATFPVAAALETGAAAGCSANLAQAEAEGAGFTSGGPGGTTTFELLPRTHPTIRIRIGAHRHRTIRPPYGVYVGTGPLPQR
jgi:hypothetical protein